MLYRLDPHERILSPLEPLGPSGNVSTLHTAVAQSLEGLFRPTRLGEPIVVIKRPTTLVDAAGVAVAVDAEARLVLVACTSPWADRPMLEQLLDRAASYGDDPYRRLAHDWAQQGGSPDDLLPRLQTLCDDPSLRADDVARDHVLVVVAPGFDGGFHKIADFLERRGVLVHFVPLRAYEDPNGEPVIDVPHIELSRGRPNEYGGEDERSWLLVLDEPGVHRRFIEQQVAAVWGHFDGPVVLQQGVQPGDVVYAYELGVGVVLRGIVMDLEIRRAEPDEGVFPACQDGNEWQLRVEWIPPPRNKPLKHAVVRRETGAGLAVRTTFSRLWRGEVCRALAQYWE